MRYKVIRNCYWNRRLWEKGEEVELEENVPEHFRPLYSPSERLAVLQAGVCDAVEATAAATPEPDNSPGTALEDMNVCQLQKLARESGLEMPKTAKKEELISALRGE